MTDGKSEQRASRLLQYVRHGSDSDMRTLEKAIAITLHWKSWAAGALVLLGASIAKGTFDGRAELAYLLGFAMFVLVNEVVFDGN